ncbi:hypothetical protein N1M2_61 [Klebsiella phage N1M2]|uniref:Uncharacterized protein n=1 Tax=Klebsiella phage N1M2 TaxID=2664939 RepID=A0A6B7ZF94_9CAUD|nr:hypothetical protein PQB72_gp061 [Klebsiella phage N1M2]QGH71924.1 hypothetical protein N1M2_61 [Klebsiella phage N1M2]
MFKYNNPAHNEAELSFRQLVTQPFFKDLKHDFIHNFKNMCYHSSIGNLFANQYIKPDAKVRLVREIVGCDPICKISMSWDQEDEVLTLMNGVIIELKTERLNASKAFLAMSADKEQIGFDIEIHVHFKTGIKSVYKVPNNKLKEALIIALG